MGIRASFIHHSQVPPFVLGCINTVAVGYFSDKKQLRGPFIIGGCFLALIGYIILNTTSTAGAGYAGTFLATGGVFPTIAVHLAWAGSNAGGDVRKGTISTAFLEYDAHVLDRGRFGQRYWFDLWVPHKVTSHRITGFGNLGGVCSSFIYIHPPRYRVGHSTILGWLSLS